MSQGSKSVSRTRGLSVLFLTLALTQCMPHAFAQDAAPSPEAVSNTTIPALAQQQGKADTAILDWVLANSGPVKGDARTGDLRIAFTVTPAEGWWDKAGGGKLTWHDAPANNIHLRIFVLGFADGRFIPGLSLHATLIDSNNNEQSVPVDFGWYPLMNAYGGNVPLESDGIYTLRVAIESESSHLPAGVHTGTIQFPPVQIAQEFVSGLPLATAMAWANEAELLKPSNAALSAAITALWQHTASGAEKPSDDYFVGYALDDFDALQIAEKIRLKKLVHLGGKDDVRLAVIIRDSRTGRFMSGLKPQATLVSPDGKLDGPSELLLTLHPWLNHYERNASISRKGAYKLRVHFEAPGYRRWGHQSERFAAPADVEFDNVSLKPEKKD